MRILILVAVGLLAVDVSGAGRASLVLGAGKFALDAHVGEVGMTLNIKLDL